MILIIGDAMLDRYLCGKVDRISPEAPVPIVHIESKKYSLGGAANVAANIVGLGLPAVLVGACGKDKHATTLRLLLRDIGITDYLVGEKDRPTTMKTRIIAGTQQLLRMDDEITRPLYSKGRNKLLSKVESILNLSHVVILSDYGKGVVTDELAAYVISSSKAPVFVDPKGTDWIKYNGAFCITPNLKEFKDYASTMMHESVTSESRLKELAKSAVTRLQIDFLVITRGGDGMLVVPKKGVPLNISVETVEEIVDVSGAGDTVIAALACALLKGESMIEAAKFANRAAGLVVSRMGTSPIKIGDKIE